VTQSRRSPGPSSDVVKLGLGRNQGAALAGDQVDRNESVPAVAGDVQDAGAGPCRDLVGCRPGLDRSDLLQSGEVDDRDSVLGPAGYREALGRETTHRHRAGSGERLQRDRDRHCPARHATDHQGSPMMCNGEDS
jgi:hypothetical protein